MRKCETQVGLRLENRNRDIYKKKRKTVNTRVGTYSELITT